MVSKTLLVLTVFGSVILTSAPSLAQWVPTIGLFGGSVRALATNGTETFVGLEASNNGGNLYRTTNNGQMWVPANTGLALPYWAVFSNGTHFLTISTMYGYVYRWSEDSAAWIQRGKLKGVPPYYVPGFGVKDSNIFLATSGGIQRSGDEGLTWTIIDSGLRSFSGAGFAVIGTNLFTQDAYGKVYRSTNDGDSWTIVNPTFPTTDIFALTVSGSSLISGTNSGVILSNDSGKSWHDISSNLPSDEVDGVLMLGNTIVAGSWGGIYYSTNQGVLWHQAAGIPEGIYTLIQIGNTLCAGTMASGVFLSSDTGRTWTLASTGLEPNSASSLFISGHSLFADEYETTDSGTHWGISPASVAQRISIGPYIFGGGYYGFFRSSDSGKTWDTVALPKNDYIECLLVKDNHIFVGTQDYGLFISSDSGVTWSSPTSGLPSKEVTSLCSAANYIVAGIYSGTSGPNNVYISSDEGTTWTSHKNGPYPLYPTALAAMDTTLFVGNSGGVSRSTIHDSGWQPVWYHGLLGQVNIFFELDTTLFVGANGGLFVSYDGGDNWLQADSGISYPYILSLAVYDSMLFAGTYWEGENSNIPTVWRRPLSQMTGSPYALGIKETGGDSLWFGNIPVGRDSLKIVTAFNAGKLPLTIQPIPAPQNDFITSDVSSPVELNPGESFSFTVLFHPSTPGYHSAKLVLASEAKRVIISISGNAFGGDEVEAAPQPAPLLTIVPDPISTSATISFQSASNSYADITIVNLLGTEVAKIFSGELCPGEHRFMWEPTALPDGVYQCLLRLNGHIQTLPLVVAH